MLLLTGKVAITQLLSHTMLRVMLGSIVLQLAMMVPEQEMSVGVIRFKLHCMLLDCLIIGHGKNLFQRFISLQVLKTEQIFSGGIWMEMGLLKQTVISV